jgi:hypothetical protein
MDSTNSNSSASETALLIDNACSFFMGTPPQQRDDEIVRVDFQGTIVELQPSALKTNVLARSVQQREEITKVLRKDKLARLLKHWPRLVVAMEKQEFLGLSVGDKVYPMEVLVVSATDLLPAGEVAKILTRPACNVDVAAPPKGYGLDAYDSASFFYHVYDGKHALEQINIALAAQPNNEVFLVLKGSIQVRRLFNLC